jgi:phospholipase C
VVLTLTSAYNGKQSEVKVRPRSTVSVPAPVFSSAGWYDVSVTVSGDSQYLRRLAGHIDNGQSSISDSRLGLS